MARAPSTVRNELRQSRPFRSPAQEAAVALMLTTDRLRSHLGTRLASGGITLQQYNVLRILRGAHPEALPTLEIADRMIEQTPGITRLLDRLEAKGLVRRDRGRADRRCVHCTITATGLALLERLEAPMHDAATAAFRGLGRTRLRGLVDLLDRVRQRLVEDATPPAGENEAGTEA